MKSIEKTNPPPEALGFLRWVHPIPYQDKVNGNGI
jgi:hypothetical protein